MIFKSSTDTKRGFVGAKVFCRENTLAYHQPQFTGGIPLLTTSHSLQGEYPCLPPTTVYRENTLAYHQPQFTGIIPLLTTNHSLQGEYPCLPQPQFTGRIPLLTTNHSLQGEYPCLPPTTVLGHVVVLRPKPLPQFFTNVV